MAGETSLLPQYYNDDFQVLSFPLITTAGVTDPLPILYADRDMVIDEIVVAVPVVGTGGTATINFEISTNPLEQGGTSMCTINVDTANIVAGDTLVAPTDNVLRYSLAGALQTTAVGSTAINGVTAGVQSNCIPKGSWLIIDPNTATAARVIVQIRFRSRLK